MRLFDKTLLATKDQAQRNYLESAIVVNCDAIASHYGNVSASKTTDDVEWNDSMAPYCRVPWPFGFLEWDIPETLIASYSAERMQQFGWMIKEAGLDDRRQCEANLLQAGVVAKAEHPIIVAEPHFTYRGQPMYYPVTMFVAVSSEGMQIGHGYQTHGLSQQQAERLVDSMSAQKNVLLLALTFLNCANVKLEDSTEELQPPLKIRRRLKLPEVKRYTLNICGHSTKPRHESTGDPQTGIMPFHLCRGHFATYTADKPLFGNPKNVGRFWIPPHTKGKKERGEIVKDYAIVN